MPVCKWASDVDVSPSQGPQGTTPYKNISVGGKKVLDVGVSPSGCPRGQAPGFKGRP